jgi:hypothetical protein
MKETATAVQPGTGRCSCKVTANKVLEKQKSEGGTVLKSRSIASRKRTATALAGVQAALPALSTRARTICVGPSCAEPPIETARCDFAAPLPAPTRTCDRSDSCPAYGRKARFVHKDVKGKSRQGGSAAVIQSGSAIGSAPGSGQVRLADQKLVSSSTSIRKEARMRFLITTVTAVLLATGASAQICQFQGNQTRCDNGLSAQRYGNRTYWNDGTSSMRSGNTTYYGDGSSSYRNGNGTYFSDGTSAQTYGNTTYFSNGRSCQRYGNQVNCR